MRILVVGLLVVASVIVAQVRRDPATRLEDMQRATMLLDKPLGARAFNGAEITYNADSVKREGSVVLLEGHVRISGKGFVMTADRAEYRPESGQIEAKGAMHVQVLK